MAKLVPKLVLDDAWVPLVQQRDYAVLCNSGDSAYLRFGLGHGMYIGVDPTPSGRVVNSINFEDGAPSLMGKIPSDTKVILGRTSDCAVKIMHAIVSRHHLEITMTKNILVLRDLGSTNGTFIHNGAMFFDIEKYNEEHPPEKAAENTLDEIHQAFGPELDDFLMSYHQSKKEK